MVRLVFFSLFAICLSDNGFTDSLLEPTPKEVFGELAGKLRLKTPKLKEGEYEIRIWNQQGLMFGTAQMLYVLSKKQDSMTVFKYLIRWNRNRFKYATKLQPNGSVSSEELWIQLTKNDLLTLPDEAAIYAQLHPRQPKDSSWTSVETDGSISVHAKKFENSVWILDGEGYYVEIFGPEGYRGYSYSNPRGYIRHKPDIVELQKMVAILDEMAALFR